MLKNIKHLILGSYMYVSDMSNHNQLLLKEDLWEEYLICQNLGEK